MKYLDCQSQSEKKTRNKWRKYFFCLFYDFVHPHHQHGMLCSFHVVWYQQKYNSPHYHLYTKKKETIKIVLVKRVFLLTAVQLVTLIRPHTKTPTKELTKLNLQLVHLFFYIHVYSISIQFEQNNTNTSINHISAVLNGIWQWRNNLTRSCSSLRTNQIMHMVR